MAREFVNCYPSHNDFPSQRILIIADSRGRQLDLELSYLVNCDLRIVTCGGASLLASIERSKSHIAEAEWTQIYCLAGICGLTYKNKKTRKVSLCSNDPEATAQVYEQALILAEKRIRCCLSTQNCKIIFAPLTGMSLNSYNRIDDVTYQHDDQVQLNITIKLVNRVIIKFNETNEVVTPWMTRLIHRRHRNTFMNSYHRLRIDGCHLSPEIRLDWAKALKNAIMKNIVDLK